MCRNLVEASHYTISLKVKLLLHFWRLKGIFKFWGFFFYLKRGRYTDGTGEYTSLPVGIEQKLTVVTKDTKIHFKQDTTLKSVLYFSNSIKCLKSLQ